MSSLPRYYYRDDGLKIWAAVERSGGVNGGIEEEAAIEGHLYFLPHFPKSEFQVNFL